MAIRKHTTSSPENNPITTARTRNRFSSRMASGRRSERSHSRAWVGQALILALVLSITACRSPIPGLPSGSVFGGGLIFKGRSFGQSRCFESCKHPVSIRNPKSKIQIYWAPECLCAASKIAWSSPCGGPQDDDATVSASTTTSITSVIRSGLRSRVGARTLDRSL